MKNNERKFYEENKLGSFYVEIIGDESKEDEERKAESDKENDFMPTLAKCKRRIESSFKLLERIEHAKDIKENTIIYLVAHGDDPLANNNPKYGDKSAHQVAELVIEILREAGFEKNKPFKGRIVLEGCHSAEETKDKSSFLEKFREKLKSLKGEIFDNTVEIGGYLGQAFDGDYSKTGYGVASTENPFTINFQKKRRAAEAATSDSSKNYLEGSSFYQVRINQKIDMKATRQYKFNRPSTSVKTEDVMAMDSDDEIDLEHS